MALALLFAVALPVNASDIKTNEVHPMGYIPTEDELEHPEIYKISEFEMFSLDDTASHKAVYDPRKQSLGYKLPAVRNQGSYGTCWAHAATACLEISLIKNHGVSSAINLSELQLANASYFHPGNDPMGYLGKDTYSCVFNTTNKGSIGGNDSYASNVLSMRVGLVDENKYPEMAYTNMYNYSFKKLPSKYSYQNQYAVLDDFFILYNPTKNDIKSAVEKYGAVKVSYYHGSDSTSGGKNGAYKNPAGYSGTNHAVVIVGWDDNFSKNNYNQKPANDGAWIIRNSWGSYYGDDGYMYMSYEEPTLSTFAVYSGNLATKDYQRVYQYDSMPFKSYYSAGGYKFANTFTAKNKEEIGAVQIGCDFSKGSTYNVEVYVGCTSANPESGTKAASKSGTFDRSVAKAVYCVDLGKIVTVKEGQTFSVVVTLDSGCYMYVDSPANSQNRGSYTITWSPETKANTSFMKSSYASSYSSMGYNLCIKALSAKPTTLGAFSVTKHEGNTKGVALKWTKSKNAKGYRIYRNDKLVKTITDASTLSWVDTTPKSHVGKVYTYKVQAYRSSVKKNAAEVKACYLKPVKVTAAKNPGAGVAKLTYSKSTSVTGYKIVYSTSKTFSTVKTVNTKETTVKIKGLKKGKTYYFKIRPFKKSGTEKLYGAWSAVKALKIVK